MTGEIKKFYNRKAVRIGNSSGVLLPKSLLGSDVRVMILNPAGNIKRDIMRILEPILEEVLGVYILGEENGKNDILVVSTKIRKDLDKIKYKIRVVPLIILKKTLKTNSKLRDDLNKAKVVINKKLLSELQV